ncbi:hypothetical protein BGZ46_002289 [Entomortierella lignicola]|nr:hypothetical protein BGZ46_002289 [Entomortierella lignicola]
MAASYGEVFHIESHYNSARGENVILWDDVLMAFENASHIQKSGTMLSFLRNEALETLTPRQFRAYPDIVLDVVIRLPLYEPRINTSRIEDSQFSNPTASASSSPTASMIAISVEQLGISENDKAPSSEMSDPESQYIRGLAFYNGKGVAKDYIRAFKHFLNAANQDHLTSQRFVGSMYEQGEGVRKDYTKVIFWINKAADRGCANAQCILGNFYFLGHVEKGVPLDYLKAVKLYQKAVDNGGVNCKNNLGHMYDYGKGIPQDYSKALKLYLEAAKAGHAKAQCNVGIMYYNGKGVSKDYLMAKE